MSRLVLDAWALLALLQREEPAATRVRQIIDQAAAGAVEVFVSTINLVEVYYRIGRIGGERLAAETYADLRRLPVTVLSATDDRVIAAAGFKVRHRVSYADAFAASTARELDATLATGDPELILIRGEVKLEPLSRG